MISRYQQEIDEVNKNLSPHEQIKRFCLFRDEWSTATGELSPTLKLRRNIVYEKYATILKEIFRHDEAQDEKEMLNKMKKKMSS